MNKRIKFKKGILHKRCDENCPYYRIIVKKKLLSNNVCIGCKHKHISDKIVNKNTI